MLATRPCNTKNSHWPFSKYDSAACKPSSGLRMSGQYDSPLPTQPEWQGQYSYLTHSESTPFSQSSGQTHGSGEPSRPRRGVEGEHSGWNVQGQRGHHPALLGSPVRMRSQSADDLARISDRASRKDDERAVKPEKLNLGESMFSNDTTGLPIPPNQFGGPGSSTGPGSEVSHSRHGLQHHLSTSKELEDHDVDDEEMLEEAEPSERPQTTAERVAARRKMKRFRLTHQQTRFLTSEFAKQPHPDAAHRERLSREIPGLSPRQVQVWFQNRRAKIKRLTADDRDRMIKMRAVPDDFDNVQALHSPYGAVHAIGGGVPMASAVEFANPSYGNHLIRPLMADARRPEGGSQMSPTGITSSFTGIEFGQSGPMSVPGIVSPISPNSNDRYTHGGHASSAVGGRPGPLDPSLQTSRHGIRAIQPFHPRDLMSRPRIDPIPSPLRPGMPWKPESMEYSMYPGVDKSPNLPERSTLSYHSGQMGQTTSSGIGGLDNNPYSSSNTQTSTGMSYMGYDHASQNRSRFRASSASLPLNLDLRNQYRSIDQGLHSPTQTTSNRAAGPTSQYGSSSSYTTSYPSAPLSAPLEFSQPRSASTQANLRDYTDAPINSPPATTSDYPETFQTSLGSQEPRSDARDIFNSGTVNYSHSQPRNDNYRSDIGGSTAPRRERSYTISGAPGVSSTDSGPASQSHAARLDGV